MELSDDLGMGRRYESLGFTQVFFFNFIILYSAVLGHDS